ncbi:MAG: hypothetical protein WC858_00400 [Parcubacteria group bacterium]|jgi:hypothetical protein
MQSKIIIIATIILFIAGIAVLFMIESLNHNYDYGKSWSVVYFSKPSDNSADFTIENHQGADENYKYSYQINGEAVSTGETEVPAGGKVTVAPPQEYEMKLQEARESVSAPNVIVDVILDSSEYKINKVIRNQ